MNDLSEYSEDEIAEELASRFDWLDEFDPAKVKIKVSQYALSPEADARTDNFIFYTPIGTNTRDSE